MKLVIHRKRLALLAGAVLFAPGAWCVTPLKASAPRTEAVKFSPAQAATPAGAASLHAKLREAAERVCSDPSDPAALLVNAEGRQSCVEDALDTAVRAASIPMLSVMHSYAGRQPVVASR